MDEQTPVLIVGGGPVGLALAGDLGFRGQKCILIDRSDGAVVQPKMMLVGVRTMEFCRRWGISQRVASEGYPLEYSQDYAYVTALGGYELARERFPCRKDEPLPEQSPQKRERCPQTHFDPILRDWATSYSGVSLRHRTELVDFEERDGKVFAQVRDLVSGRSGTIAADYLIGADGASSTVRRKLGISMSGEGLLNYTTHVLFRSRELGGLHKSGTAYRFIFIGLEGTWLTITSINGDDLWRLQLIGKNKRPSVTRDEIARVLRRAANRDIDFEIVDIMPWARRELVADSYGRGQVYLAGDAAHLTSPTGAFGMNTGIQDAVDLGWKLDAALSGWGGDRLLESYEIERRPVAVRNVTEATVNLSRMLSTRRRMPPPNLLDESLEAEAARLEYGQWYAEAMRPEWHTIGINLGYRYDDSPIVIPDGTPQPPDEVSTYTQTARPGARAPHVWLDEGISTLDWFGDGFVLLCDMVSEGAEQFREAAAARGMPLVVKRMPVPKVQKAYGSCFVLVRPDGHVAWRSEEIPERVGDILDVVRGAVPTCADISKTVRNRQDAI